MKSSTNPFMSTLCFPYHKSPINDKTNDAISTITITTGGTSSTPAPTSRSPLSQLLSKQSLLTYLITLILLVFILIQGYTCIVIAQASETLRMTLYRLINTSPSDILWTINQEYDLIFLIPELGYILYLHHFISIHFYGTFFFTILRFYHLAINLKQAVQPELSGYTWANDLIRQELSHIFTLNFVYFNLLLNLILCCLLCLFAIQRFYEDAEEPETEPKPKEIILP